MSHAVPVSTAARSEADTLAFRQAHTLLVVFGISAVPATLMLGVMGIDFLEGDFGPAGTTAMTLAGGTSILCAVVSARARRLWAAGRPLNEVLAAIWRPLTYTLLALYVSMLAVATQFS